MRKYRIVAVFGVLIFAIFGFVYIYKRLWKKWNQSYQVVVEVEDAGSLALGTHVFMNGVKMGEVKNIFLNREMVAIELEIDRRVKIPVGSQVKIIPIGVMGKLNVSIYRAKDVIGYLKNGDIIKGSGPTSPGIILERVSTIAEQVSNLVEELRLERLGDTFNEISDKINDVFDNNKELFKDTADRVNSFVKDINSRDVISGVGDAVKSLSRSSSFLANLFDLSIKGEVDYNSALDSSENYQINIGVDAPFIYFSKLFSASSDWSGGYRCLIKKRVSIMDLMIGFIFDTLGCGVDFNISNYFKFGARVAFMPSIKRLELFGRFIKSGLFVTPFYSISSDSDMIWGIRLGFEVKI